MMEFNRGENNAKRKKAQILGTSSGRGSVSHANSRSDVGRSDTINGIEKQVRVTQSPRDGRNSHRRVLGGIITQLIEDLEDQLGENQQTIEMLDKKCQRIEKRLNHLRQLQSLVKEESEI